EGFVKVLADETGRLIGGAIVAPRAGEMVQELALAISLGVTAQQVAMTIHAFPTFSEAVAAACAKV
ncbi:MAG TPA: dihydrolipoyl dehydrogenase, partial [Dehalococcoidia bacterium]|nr:dihydrolipoyl dehydrogenase [Dehalococcoidia bacterium]